MFLLAYILFFTNIAIILRLVIDSCRVTKQPEDNPEEDGSETEEDEELLRAFILNNKKRKRAEKVSRSTTPTIPEDDEHDKEPTFHENF